MTASNVARPLRLGGAGSRKNTAGEGKEMVGWDGINPPIPGFQARFHPATRTNDLLMCVMIRSLRGIDLYVSFRIGTDSDA